MILSKPSCTKAVAPVFGAAAQGRKFARERLKEYGFPTAAVICYHVTRPMERRAHKEKVVDKPWGYEIIWAHTERYVGKILHINKGESLSYQYHRVKDETIRLLSGALEMDIELNGERDKLRLAPGDSLHITPGMKHRMIALEDCDVLEVSTPELDDVVRLEDRYGRADPSGEKSR